MGLVDLMVVVVISAVVSVVVWIVMESIAQRNVEREQYGTEIVVQPRCLERDPQAGDPLSPQCLLPLGHDGLHEDGRHMWGNLLQDHEPTLPMKRALVRNWRPSNYS